MEGGTLTLEGGRQLQYWHTNAVDQGMQVLSPTRLRASGRGGRGGFQV